MAFTAGTPFVGGLSRAFLQGILSDIAKGIGNPNPLAATIPETVYMCFQMTFAIITPALIAGAFAERMKFSAMLWFIGLWAIFVYAPVAHWVWGPDGFLNSGNDDAWVKVLDFAGGTVVHINAGVAGLMCALVLGKRKDTGPAHNVVLTFIGASLLWVGWFGFNAGSAVTAGLQAGMAMTVTQIATAVAGLTWMFVEWAHRGKPTVIGICSGAVAGLVAITPASGFVGPVGAMAIGVAAGVVCYSARCWLKHMFGYDDALDCFGVHAVGGAAGAILTGVFAISEYGGTSGLIEGNAGQVINQLIGVGIVIVYDVIVCLIILKVSTPSSACASMPRSSAKGSTSRSMARRFNEAFPPVGETWGCHVAPPLFYLREASAKRERAPLTGAPLHFQLSRPLERPPDRYDAVESDVAILLKTPLRFEPTSVTAAMMTTEMSAAIRPYSIAVAPLSSRRRLLRTRIVASCKAIVGRDSSV